MIVNFFSKYWNSSFLEQATIGAQSIMDYNPTHDAFTDHHAVAPWNPLLADELEKFEIDRQEKKKAGKKGARAAEEFIVDAEELEDDETVILEYISDEENEEEKKEDQIGEEEEEDFEENAGENEEGSPHEFSENGKSKESPEKYSEESENEQGEEEEKEIATGTEEFQEGAIDTPLEGVKYDDKGDSWRFTSTHWGPKTGMNITFVVAKKVKQSSSLSQQ